MEYGTVDGVTGYYDQASDTFFPETSLQKGTVEGRPGFYHSETDTFYPSDLAVSKKDTVLGNFVDKVKSTLGQITAKPAPAQVAVQDVSTPTPTLDQNGAVVDVPEPTDANGLEHAGKKLAAWTGRSIIETAKKGAGLLNTLGELQPEGRYGKAETPAITSAIREQIKEVPQNVENFYGKEMNALDKQYDPEGIAQHLVAGLIEFAPQMITTYPLTGGIASTATKKLLSEIGEKYGPKVASMVDSKLTQKAIEYAGTTAKRGAGGFAGGVSDAAVTGNADKAIESGLGFAAAEAGLGAAGDALRRVAPVLFKDLRAKMPESVRSGEKEPLVDGEPTRVPALTAEPQPSGINGEKGQLYTTPEMIAGEPGAYTLRPMPEHEAIMSKRASEMTPDESRYALTHDNLTGLPNKKALEEAPETSHLGLLDIDGFKKVNDIFGHDAGNRYLQRIREAAEAAGIKLYRLHGDEHAFTANSESEGINTALSLDNALKDVTIKVTDVKTGRAYELSGVGFSYGIGKGDNLNAKFQSADRELYVNKDFRTGVTGQRVPGNFPTEVSVTPTGTGGRGRQELVRGVSQGQGDLIGTPHPDRPMLEEAGYAFLEKKRHGEDLPFMMHKPGGWTYDEAGQFLLDIANGSTRPKSKAQQKLIDEVLSYKRGEVDSMTDGVSARETEGENAYTTTDALRDIANDSVGRENYAQPSSMGNPEPKADSQIEELHSFPSMLHPDFLATKLGGQIRKVTNWVADATPERVKEFIGKFLSTDNFAVESHPVRKPIYDLNNERTEKRVSAQSDVLTPDVQNGYAGAKAMFISGKKERAELDSLLVAGDREAKIYTDAELKSGRNPLGRPISDKVIAAYRTSRQLIQRTQDKVRELSKELALAPYEDKGWFNELRMRFEDELQHGRMSHRSQLTDVNITMQKLRPLINAIREHDQIYAQNPGYIPRTRKEGDWVVRVNKVETATGEVTPAFMDITLTKLGADSLAKNVVANPAKYMPVNSQLQGYTFVADAPVRSKSLDESMFMGIGNDGSRALLIERAVEKAQKIRNMSQDDADVISHEIISALQGEIAARGAGRAFLKRSDHYIEGFQNTDIPNVLIGHTSGMLGMMTKAHYALKGIRALRDIPKADSTDSRWANQYFQDSLKNSDWADKAAGKVRGLATMYYLAGNLKSAVVNSFQHYMTAIPEMSRYTKSATMIMETAHKDVVFNHLTDWDKKVLEEAMRKGIDLAKNVREITGLADNVYSRGYSKAIDVGMKAFQYVESKMNRETAFLAAMRLFSGKKKPNGQYYGVAKNGQPYSYSYEEAFKKATDFVNATHYNIGKENMPEAIRSLGAIGRTAYTFQSYTHNYLHWMFNRATQGEIGVVARSLMVTAALGGVTALPMAEDVNGYLRKYFGVNKLNDIRKAVRAKLKESGAADYTDVFEDIIMNGLPTLAGANLSRAVSVNLPLVGDADKTLDERFAGVWAGIVKKAVSAVQSAGKGDYYRAAEYAAPESIANPMKAARQWSNPATDSHGRIMLDSDGQPVKYTGREAITKTVGVVPQRIAKLNDTNSARYAMQEYWGGQRRDLLDKLRIAVHDKGDIQAVSKEIADWNNEMMKSDAKFLIKPILPHDAIEAVQEKPIKRRIMFGRDYEGK